MSSLHREANLERRSLANFEVVKTIQHRIFFCIGILSDETLRSFAQNMVST